MAKFNNEIYDISKLEENDYKQAGMYLQAILSKEDLEKLRVDWNNSGGYEVIPWWKFAFDNIKVEYK